MNAKQARQQYGDSAQWTAADFDSYFVRATNTSKHLLACRVRKALRTLRHNLHLAA